MHRYAITCEKGGVGKTSLCVGLACALGAFGRRVLVVDCDGQGSATRWLGAEVAPGLTRVFSGEAELAPLVLDTEAKGVNLIPAAAGLATLDRGLSGEPGAETLLRCAFADLPDQWDDVLLDTPPNLGLVVIAALTAATEALIPVEARPMGAVGLERTLMSIERVRKRLNPDLGEPRLVLSRTTNTRVSRDVEAEVRQRFMGAILAASIPERVSVTRASGMRVPVAMHDPEGKPAQAYRDLATELLKSL